MIEDYPSLAATRRVPHDVLESESVAETIGLPKEDVSSFRAWTSVAALPRITMEGEGASTPEPVADLTVLGTLGQGGMGRVLLARQRSIGRDVAVKVLHDHGRSRDASALLLEARITGRLEHPNIVPVHALGTDEDGAPVLVMKRIDGVPWRALVERADHPIWQTLGDDPLRAHLEILMAVSNALHFAHSRGVIHRDVKPDNVMIGAFGEVYLTDWGVATTRAEDEPSAIVGTPAFMAPEMLRADPRAVDARTDVYLLGATLHFLLTGAYLHPGKNVHAVLLSVLRSEPPAYEPSVPAELAAIARRATAAALEDRFESALALRLALAEHLEHRGSLALAEQALERLAALRGEIAKRPAREQDEADVTRVRRLATEARFGFVEALRGWSGNEPAHAGLRACLEALACFELDRGQAEAARTVLAGLSPPPVELCARLEEHDAKAREEQARRADLEGLAQQMDVGVGARQRSRAMLWLTGIAALAGIPAGIELADGGAEALDHEVLIGFSATVFGIAAGAVVIARRTLLSTAVNRQLYTLLLALFGGQLLNRIFAARLGVSPETVFAFDAIVCIPIIATAALTSTPRFWAAGGLVVVSAAVMFAIPEHIAITFCVMSLLLPVAAIWALNGLTAREAPPRAPDER